MKFFLAVCAAAFPFASHAKVSKAVMSEPKFLNCLSDMMIYETLLGHDENLARENSNRIQETNAKIDDMIEYGIQNGYLNGDTADSVKSHFLRKSSDALDEIEVRMEEEDLTAEDSVIASALLLSDKSNRCFLEMFPE